MKTLTCADVGGPCDMQLIAGNETDMMSLAWHHMQTEHPAFAADILQMTAEEKDMLRVRFKSLWGGTTDDHDMMGGNQ